MKDLVVLFFLAIFCPLYHHVSGESVQQCYFCAESCNDPLDVVDCNDTNNVCLSYKEISNNGSIESVTKGCYSKNITETCQKNDTNLDVSCYTCDEDLCNGSNKSNDGGVKKCYSCSGTCENPLVQEECSIEEGTKKVCLSLEITTEDARKLEIRGCYNDSIKSSCKSMEEDHLSWCYTCDQDLCNGVDFVDGVKQCYSCTGDCSQLELQKCPVEAEVQHVCMSQTTIENGTTVITKGCGKTTDLESCRSINETGNSTCYTCDEDFCNKKNEINNLLAKKCYYCQDTCNDPLDQEECPYSDAKDYICTASKYTLNGTFVETRGCSPYDEKLILNCNTTYTVDSFCYACDTDLCNDYDNSDDNNSNQDNGSCNNPPGIYLVSTFSIGLTILLKTF